MSIAIGHNSSLLHVGIIMDGNGRWAQARGLPRVAGHSQGAKAVRRVIESAPSLGIGTLTLYAFSSDNWRRPRPEVQALMRFFLRYLLSEVSECVENGVRISVIGRRDRLPARLQRAIRETEESTRGGRTLLVRLAVDYSARDVILRAAQCAALEAAAKARRGEPLCPFSRDHFTRLMAATMCADAASDLDLLVRTGGEQRISDFLLWEAAYAELLFTPRMWPDFDGEDLAAAVEKFHQRERRFGAVPETQLPVAVSQLPALDQT